MWAISPCMKRCSTRAKPVGTSGLPAQQRRHFSEKRGDLLDLEPDSFDQNIAIKPAHRSSLLRHSVSAYWHSRTGSRTAAPLDYFCQFHQRHHLAMNRGEYTIAKTAVSAAARCLLLAFVMNKLAFMKCVLVYQNRYDYSGNGLLRRTDCQRLVPWGRWGYPADIASTVRAMRKVN